MYVGGVLGFGDCAGLYLTTRPMIGSNPDWAIGGGIHIAKAFGLGMVIPVRQAMQSAQKHNDKVAVIQDYATDRVSYLSDAIVSAGNFMAQGGLEALTTVANLFS